MKARIIGPTDPRALTPQLIGHEGWRVEVVTTYGETQRFIVGRSTGWQPCHITLKRRDSMGGYAAEREYRSVTRLYPVTYDAFMERMQP